MRSQGFTRIARWTMALAVLAMVVVLSGVMALSGLPGNTLSYAQDDATPTPYPDALAAALERARTFSGSNDDWETFVWNFDGVEMVLVSAGCFMMGSTEDQIDAALAQCNEEYGDCEREWLEHEGPAHKVCFEEPFWLDHTEVTNGQYGSEGDFSGGERPREYVTWFEAQDFCERRGARLPTEAEWEYAARGPEGWVYPWGNDFEADNVVYSENSGGQTTDVGSRPGGASWVGALDMSGNVWEWVVDWYDAGYYGTLADGVVNPTGPESGANRVLRGGSFFGATDLLRGANRNRIFPDFTNFDLGFRCARSASD